MHNKVLEAIAVCELEYYRFRRYGIVFSVVLVCFEEGVRPEGLVTSLQGYVRKVDRVEPNNDAGIVIVLGHCGWAESGQALKHLRPLLDESGFRYHVGSATVEAEDEGAKDVVLRATEEMGGPFCFN